MNVAPALVLLGMLHLCGRSAAQTLVDLQEAARTLKRELPCSDWKCDCAFGRPRGCCCAANEMFDIENDSWKRMVRLWGQITTLDSNARALEGGLRYAFKASMEPNGLECFGPFTTDVTIPYRDVSINENNGYNPSLGIFTAHENGVYAFSYSVYSRSNRLLSYRVVFMKNSEALVTVKEYNRDDKQDSGSQTVPLELQKGDQVYVVLKSGNKLCGELQYNIFTGYMLYPNINYMYSAESQRFLSYYET